MAVEKKGQSDMFGAGIFVFITIIIVAIFFRMYSTLSVLPIFQNSTVANNVMGQGTSLFSGFDFSIPMILFAINLGSLISMYFLRTHPILMIVAFIMIPITIIGAAALSNSYEDANASLNLQADFPISTFIMTWLPIILFVFDFVGSILLFTVF